MASLFSSLPIDIARLVFEKAAESGLDAASVLVLVCKAVQRWVDPILYHDVCLDKSRSIILFSRTVHEAPRPSTFYASYVKRLAICIEDDEDIPNWEMLHRIIKACSGIQSLLVWTCTRETEATRETSNILAISPISPTRLCCSIDVLETLSPTIVSSVTHLDIGMPSTRAYNSNVFSALMLDRFPNLSHLSLNTYSMNCTDVPRRLYSRFDPLPSSLKVVILHLGDSRKDFRLTEKVSEWINSDKSDARIIYEGYDNLAPQAEASVSMQDGIIWRNWRGHLRDWTLTCAGEKDAWDLAEEICTARIQARASASLSNEKQHHQEKGRSAPGKYLEESSSEATAHGYLEYEERDEFSQYSLIRV